jgi:hypothetical protein
MPDHIQANATSAPSSSRSFPPNAVHLVRTSQQMQLQLSQMADQKASMLMAASSVMFTLAVGQLRAGGGMVVPLTLLATTTFVAALFAILAVIPRVTRPREGSVGNDDNILFFGNFSALPEDAFIDRALDRMMSDESTYRTMLRDIYQAGCVLARGKYRYLAIAYRCLLSGLLLTMIAALAEIGVSVL